MEHPAKAAVQNWVTQYLRGLCALEPHGEAESQLIRTEMPEIIQALREAANDLEKQIV